MKYKYIKNKPITHFLYTEPVTADVSHIYKSNYEINPSDYSEYIQKAYSFMDMLSPHEGNAEILFDTPVKWRLLRMSGGDIKPTWAVFGVNAKLILNFIYCDITVKKSGIYRFDLSSACAVYVRINGEEIFRKNEFRRVGSDSSIFEAYLNEGKNSFLMMLLNVNLHSINSFSLTLKDCEFDISLPTDDIEERIMLEEDFKRLYIPDTVIRSDKRLELFSDGEIKTCGKYIMTVCDENGYVLSRYIEINQPLCFNILICEMNCLKDGIQYTLSVQFSHSAGIIQGPVFEFEKLTCTSPPCGFDFNSRRQWLKKMYLTLTGSEQVHQLYYGVYGALASLLNGENPNEDLIFTSIDYINRRYDCSDFCMHGLILIIKYFSDKISAKCLNAAKRCILDFKYNEEDEGLSMMFCRSENHSMLFASLEYITGLMYPDEIFSQSGKSGCFQSERGKATAEKWIDEKLTYGFTEWHSNTYYEEDMISLLNIINFSSGQLADKAKQLLDMICELFASHASHGIMATTHGRCYEKNLLYPITEPVGHLTWLLTGVSDEIQIRLSTGVIVMLCGKYMPPLYTEQLAAKFPLVTKSRMGLFKDRCGAPCVCYRHKSYSVSALIEYRYGSYGQQTHPGQVLINNNIPVFATSFENASKNTRPSYWGGQYRMPKTICTAHTLAYLYSIETEIGYTHCYFPATLFDSYTLMGNHIFGEKDNTYVCVYNPDGFTLTSHGTYKNRELMCYSKRTAWIIEIGTAEEYGSFDNFTIKCTDAAHKTTPDGILYHSPHGEEICLFYENPCTINGLPNGSCNMLIDNDFIKRRYG